MNQLLHIFRRLPAAIATMVAFGVSAAPQAVALEPYTPQAIDANAQFLSYAPAIAGRPDMKVCVVDTGVDLTTDAAPAVVDRQTVFPNGPVGDGGGGGLPKHGTYVAGVIASQANDRDSVGIWPWAKIVSVRVFEDKDSGTTAANYILALERCRLAGAKVVNLSLSGLDTASVTELSFLENKIADLRSVLGMDIVAGAGNSGAAVGYPAAFPEVFAVGASDATGAFCTFSSRGSALDISTFGCGVELTFSTGGITHASGTSLSTPVVSGVLAALRYYRPDLAPDRAEQLLLDNASRGAAGLRLNAAKAFRAAGLGSVVDTPAPRVAPRSAPSAAPASWAPSTTVGEVPAGAAPSAPADPLATLGVHPPKLRSSSYSKGVLSVTVSGVPDFGRAIFTVAKHRYTRASGRLRIHLKRTPKKVSVVIDVPGVGRTPALRVKLKAAKQRTGKR
jgi:hypothetical protein